MEQKKTLWIIAAVGVFLLVVLGAALILYSPASKGSQTVAMSRQNDSSSNGWISLAPSEGSQQQKPKTLEEDNAFNAMDMSEESESEAEREDFENRDENFAATSEEWLQAKQLPKTKPLKVGELTVYADNATIVSSRQGENTDMENPNVAKAPAQNQGYDASAITTTIDLKIDVADASASAQGTSTIHSTSSPVAPTVARAETPRAEKPAASESKPKVVKADVKPAVKQSVSKTAPAKTASAPALPKAAEKTQFWVQVTSLSSRKNADIAREVLAENEINADVFTYTDAKGKLFYRVRVGPYTTKSEAEYWQGKIAKIDNFQSSKSYIASTKTEIN